MKKVTDPKVSFNQIVRIAVMSGFMIVLGLMVFVDFFTYNKTFAVAAGDYRSKATGNWNSTATWETYNGSAWVNASATPTNGGGAITILNGHTISVTANVSVDQLIVDVGGVLTINSGKTFTISNGTGDDLTVNGTLNISGSCTNSGNSVTKVGGQVNLLSGGANTFGGGATITLNSGSRYKAEDATYTNSTSIWTVSSGAVFQHNVDGGSLPQATWSSGATCEVTGITVTKPGNLDQMFHNFTWNCPNQTSVENLSGKIENVAGNFNFISTGTGSVRLGEPENYTLNIGGDFNMQGGTLRATSRSLACAINVSGNYVQTGGTFSGNDVSKDNGEGSPTISVTGNFSISSGTFDMSQYNASSAGKGITTLNLYGNFTQTGGAITETATNTGKGDIYFKKTGTQVYTLSSGSISNQINVTINSGSDLNAGTSILSGSGTFNLSSGGELFIGSTDGITTSGATGNIQVTGTRTYSTGADYNYIGTAAQVTGNGLPATVNKLTVNNSNGVTLTNTVAVSTTLTLTSGKITTGSNELNVANTGTSAIVGYSNSNYVVGNLRRSIASTGSYDYPVGTSSDYQLLNLNLLAITGFSNVLCSFVAGNPAPSGLPSGIIYNTKYYNTMLNHGYWTLDPNSALVTGTYSVTLRGKGFSNTSAATSTDSSDYVMLKRANSGVAWSIIGTPNYSVQSISSGVLTTSISGLTSFSHFGQASGGSTLPIKLLYFNAKANNSKVDLTWSTASESNNDYFTVERAADGIRFEEVLKKAGAGNSTSINNYFGTDYNPINGNNYYRLKQTDYDGHSTYSEIKFVRMSIGAIDQTDLSIVSLFKNPFSKSFELNFNVPAAGIVEFSLLNASGQKVDGAKIQASEGYNSYEFFDKKNLTTGIYYINLIKDNQKATKKIIKE